MATYSDLLKERKRLRNEIAKREGQFDSWIRSLMMGTLKANMPEKDENFSLDLWDAMKFPDLADLELSHKEKNVLESNEPKKNTDTSYVLGPATKGIVNKLNARGREMRRAMLRELPFTLDELRKVHKKYGRDFKDPGFDLDKLSKEANELDRQLAEVERQVEKAKKEKELAPVRAARKSRKPGKRKKAVPPEPEPEQDPELAAIEQELERHKRELNTLLKDKKGMDKRENELLSRFSELGTGVTGKIMGFDSLSLEGKADSLFNSFNKEAVNALHDAVLHVYGHNAVRASGINTDKLTVSHSNDGIRYVDPEAVSVILKARELLSNGTVKPGTPKPAWEHLDSLNNAISKHFGEVIPNFDSTEKKHWGTLEKMADTVYSAMELHKDILSHVKKYGALNEKISEKKSLLEGAKKRLKEHKLKK